jgi:chemotaxis protein methyltransferase CheR
MDADQGSDLDLPRLSVREFESLQRLIEDRTGIHLHATKAPMLRYRLATRLAHHRLRRFGEYVQLLTDRDPDGDEARELVNRITTNKTSFFREPHHFEHLVRLIRERAAGSDPGRLSVWSAACSTGEEPYSIGMAVLDVLGAEAPRWEIRILATDIDTEVLDRASRAIYTEEKVTAMGQEMRRRHLLRGTGSHAGTWRVHPDVRGLVELAHFNLVTDDWSRRGPFDAVFCRNVLIYFRRDIQLATLERLAAVLHPTGRLFLGHSETMRDPAGRFEVIAPSVFRLRSTAPANTVKRSEPLPRRSEPIVTRREPPAAQPHRIILGQLHASREPIWIGTTLGSCVSACLFDPVAQVGGMNHFLLPDGSDGPLGRARYGVHAMELLINLIMKLGGDRRRLRAKLFGAAWVLTTPTDVPRRNADFVRAFVATEGIPVVAERLGGNRPLEVRFHPHDGRALVREIDSQRVAELIARERSAARRPGPDVAPPPGPPKVTLF